MDTFLSVLGIFVSLFLFLVGYRQTVGAKKERISSCNAEIEKILLRRIVLEAYTPTRIDIERLSDGKARDFRVPANNLLSVAQVLITLYTRIVESDLIAADQRRSMLEEISKVLTESEAKPVEQSDESLSTDRSFETAKTLAVGVMAILASVVGSLITTLPDISNFNQLEPGMFKTFLLTATTSLSLIALFLVAYRLRTSQEDVPNKLDPRELSSRFEANVIAILKKAKFKVYLVPPGQFGDLIVESHGRKFLIEIKYWPRRPSSDLISRMIEKLRASAQDIQADEVVVVTSIPLVYSLENGEFSGVRFLPIKELVGYLREPKRSSNEI